jgi:glycosyltransferase involved in cell wall biosynthesis
MTILTPTLNQAHYLERTILSVLNQNYPNLEYIILDGGSRDDSCAIIERYARYLSYWRSKSDDGQAAALKEGFERATGEIFAWINSDDMYFPGVLRQIGDKVRSQPDIDVCYGNMDLLNACGEVVAERRLADCSPWVIDLGIRHGGLGFYQPAAFWRKTLYDRVGGIDPSLHFDMDNDLFIRFALDGARFAFLPSSLVGFRIHEASKTFALQDGRKSEIPFLLTRYRLDQASIASGCLRSIVRGYRVWRHLLQGDAGYLLRRLLPGQWNWVA